LLILAPNEAERRNFMTGISNEVIFWLAAFIVLIIAELATMQLVSIWFAAGALVAALIAAVPMPLYIQIAVFAGVSALLLIFTRPVLKKLFSKPPVPTNAEIDIGKKALVIESIDNLKMTGRVRLNEVDWMAVSSEGQPIPAGETVVVDKIEGAKLYVSTQKEE